MCSYELYAAECIHSHFHLITYMIFIKNDMYRILELVSLNVKFSQLLINKNVLIVMYPVVMIVKHFQQVMIIN